MYPSAAEHGALGSGFWVNGERMAMIVLMATACLRLNYIFGRNNFEYFFTEAASELPHVSQVCITSTRIPGHMPVHSRAI